jgi:hypothetical protein
MAVEVAGVKKAVNLSWDTNAVGGELCRLVARNEETGAISNTNWSRNDGFGVLTYPLDYAGTTTVLVEGTGGGTEHATIEITADGASVVADTGEPVDPPDPEPEPGPDEPDPVPPVVDVL